MVRSTARQASGGFTLVELLVTISIMVVLLLAAVPYTSDWLYSAQTRDAQAKLMQGFGTAKALALRNPLQAPLPLPAAGVRLVNTGQLILLLVCAGNPDSTDCAPGGASVYLKISYPASVNTLLDNKTLSAATPLSIGLDNRGAPLERNHPDWQ